MQAAIYMLICRSENENRFFCFKTIPFQKRLNTRLLPHLQAFKHNVLLRFFFLHKTEKFQDFKKVALYRAIKLLRIPCELHMLMFNNVSLIYVYSKSYQTPFFRPHTLTTCSQHFPVEGKTFSPPLPSPRPSETENFPSNLCTEHQKVILIPKENIWFKIKYCCQDGPKKEIRGGKTKLWVWF